VIESISSDTEQPTPSSFSLGAGDVVKKYANIAYKSEVHLELQLKF
jgi:hypothetical protein